MNLFGLFGKMLMILVQKRVLLTVHICRICCYMYSIMNWWYTNCDRSYIDGKIQFHLTALWCIYLDLLVFCPDFPRVSHCKHDARLIMQNALLWRHNERDGVSNHQPHECLLKRLFRPRSEKTSQLSVTGRCEGYSAMTSEFYTQRASNAEKNVSI